MLVAVCLRRFLLMRDVDDRFEMLVTLANIVILPPTSLNCHHHKGLEYTILGPILQNSSLKDWSKKERRLFYVSVCVTKQAEPSVTRKLIGIKCLVIDYFMFDSNMHLKRVCLETTRVNFEFYSFIFFVCIFFRLVIWKLCSPFLEGFRNLFWTPPILTQMSVILTLT